MTRESGSIIQSLLDIDFYKFTMGQKAFNIYPKVLVRYAFTNRTKKVPLAKIIDIGRLREELQAVRLQRFTRSDLHYLRGTNEYQDRMFSEKYLDFLAELQLPEFKLEVVDNQIVFEVYGTWAEAIYWETIALAIINELYYEAITKDYTKFERDLLMAEGIKRLGEKIKKLKSFPEIRIVEFGTRRRYSKEWQRYVVETLNNELLPDQFVGTSNTFLAKELALLPMGTSAHEEYMVMSGIYHGSDKEIRDSHNKSLQEWWEQYGEGLSIALTDTYGSDFFFQDFTKKQARSWKGLRHDSGCPFEFGQKAISFYKKNGIDPREKMIIYSDGLNVDTIIKLHKTFFGKINLSYGWGTNLTNDLGLWTLSLVIKVVEANGHGTVKLSDNMAKAMGNPADIERFKRIFGHSVTESVECIV